MHLFHRQQQSSIRPLKWVLAICVMASMLRSTYASGSEAALFRRDANTTSSSITTTTDASTTTAAATTTDDTVVDLRTPMYTATFTTPNTWLKSEDQTIIKMWTTMNIKWKYNTASVMIAPKLLSLQVYMPLQQWDQTLVGTGTTKTNITWKDIAVNISGTLTNYYWNVSLSEGTAYKLRLFDSEIGPGTGAPGPFVPGKLGLSTSSTFIVYMSNAGTQLFASASLRDSPVTWVFIAGLATFLAAILL